MPIYEYECDACGSAFEKMQSFSDPPLKSCPQCKSKKVRKLIGNAALVFKGSGFYINDSKGKSSTTTPVPASTGAEKSSTASESSTPKSSGSDSSSSTGSSS